MRQYVARSALIVALAVVGPQVLTGCADGTRSTSNYPPAPGPYEAYPAAPPYPYGGGYAPPPAYGTPYGPAYGPAYGAPVYIVPYAVPPEEKNRKGAATNEPRHPATRDDRSPRKDDQCPAGTIRRHKKCEELPNAK